jgi:hypothetical protein
MQDREWWDELDFVDIVKYVVTKKDQLKEMIMNDSDEEEKNLLLEKEK